MIAPLSLEEITMKVFTSSGRAGMLAAATVFALAIHQPAHAETVLTVNGTDIDSTVVNLYIESRLQKPAIQATPAERDSLLGEVTDIYLLTTQENVPALMEDPTVQAQAEIQLRGLMAQVAATDFLERNTATDEEILETYASQIELAPPSQFNARHILVETQAAATDIIAQLDDGGDFQELAKAHSSDGSASQGGDLGWFLPNQMVAPFSAAVEALEDGEYTKAPVQTQFGWHVIRREGTRASEPPTLDSVRDVIKQQIEQQKLQDYLVELRASLQE
jgi:peptidyl-prolyl cis-trans isomerase C